LNEQERLIYHKSGLFLGSDLMPRKSGTQTFRQNRVKLARTLGVPVLQLTKNARTRALERTGLRLRESNRPLKGIHSKIHPGAEVIVRKGETIESAQRRLRGNKKSRPPFQDGPKERNWEY